MKIYIIIFKRLSDSNVFAYPVHAKGVNLAKNKFIKEYEETRDGWCELIEVQTVAFLCHVEMRRGKLAFAETNMVEVGNHHKKHNNK